MKKDANLKFLFPYVGVTSFLNIYILKEQNCVSSELKEGRAGCTMPHKIASFASNSTGQALNCFVFSATCLKAFKLRICVVYKKLLLAYPQLVNI